MAEVEQPCLLVQMFIDIVQQEAQDGTDTAISVARPLSGVDTYTMLRYIRPTPVMENPKMF